MNDLTAIRYTANKLNEGFRDNMRNYFILATHGILKIDYTQPEDREYSHLQIYRNALRCAQEAQTKYIALCEDDVLYNTSHFKFRPKEGHFGYNMNVWSIYTWVKPAIFSYKDRINLSGLICERDLFIEAMEERFSKVDFDNLFLGNWAEPGKYEKNLGITERKVEKFFSSDPLVAFSHPTALSFGNLGTRKKLGNPRALEIPFWGKAEDVLKMYE